MSACQIDFTQPDGKLEWNTTVEATILTANADNSGWHPTLWQSSEMFFDTSLNGPGVIVREKYIPLSQQKLELFSSSF